MSAEYRALVDKVDAFVASTTARQRAALHCQKGCEACCHVSLSVGPVEADSVRAGIAALSPEARERVRERGLREAERERAKRGEARCALLEDDGSCAIYAQRPLVCRSQGQALRYPEGFVPAEAVRLRTKAGDVTWCPLNYTTSEPRAEDVLDAERVDQILALVTHRHGVDVLLARGTARFDAREQHTADDDALARVRLSDLAAQTR